LDGGSKEMYDAITSQAQRGRKKIILDMSDAGYMDSSGVGYLVSGYTRVRNLGGELVMAAPSLKMRDLMQITKLNRVVKVTDSVSEAVTALEQESQDNKLK